MSERADDLTTLPDFELRDLSGSAFRFPQGELTLLCFVKEDCPTCRLILLVLEHWRKSFSPQLQIVLIGQTEVGNQSFSTDHGVQVPLLNDSRLRVSYRYRIEFVPTIILADEKGYCLSQIHGFEKLEWEQLEARLSGIIHQKAAEFPWSELPDLRPGCGSLSEDPIEAARLHAELEGNPLRARQIDPGEQVDVFEFLDEQGFTDGLPVVPPTPERVLRMLGGTARDSQEIVAIVPPNMGPASVEKVAINAVMAGCRPEYLPVVLAALEAVCTDEFNIHGVMATTMGAAPVLVVNGPIRHKLGMNMKQGALGQGNRANATIGRALRLVLRNLGGARPGGIERATLGSPLKFTMCFAEWEEASPWDPLHVEHGFRPEESVVTAFGMSSGPTLVVDQTSRTAAQLAGSLGLAADHAMHPRAHGVTDVLLVIPPEHVSTLQREGFGKRDIRTRIQEITAVPRRELVADSLSGVGIDPGSASNLSEEQLGQLIPKFASERDIHLVVAGGAAGKFTGIFHGWAIGPRGTQPVSRRIEEI